MLDTPTTLPMGAPREFYKYYTSHSFNGFWWCHKLHGSSTRYDDIISGGYELHQFVKVLGVSRRSLLTTFSSARLISKTGRQCISLYETFLGFKFSSQHVFLFCLLSSLSFTLSSIEYLLNNSLLLLVLPHNGFDHFDLSSSSCLRVFWWLDEETIVFTVSADPMISNLLNVDCTNHLYVCRQQFCH